MPDMPPFEHLIRMEIVHRVPGMAEAVVQRDRVYSSPAGTNLTMDVYSPPASTTVACRAAVVMIHGPAPKLGAKNMGVFQSYGRMLAASDLAAVTFNHRFFGPETLLDAASDVESAIAHVREHSADLGIDADRLAVWAFSGGGPFLSLAMRGAPSFVRALVAFYAAIDIREKAPGASDTITDEIRRDFSPANHLRTEAGRLPPIFVARAGLDHPFMNAGIDRFVAEALATNAAIDVMNHATGRHGFDILDDDRRSREIIARAVEFLRERLLV